MQTRSLLIRTLLCNIMLLGLVSLTLASAVQAQVTIQGQAGTFPTIQDAIDNARDGDVILVNGGEFNETLKIGRPLTLRGLNQPVISADGGNIITVDNPAGSVTIEGFMIKVQSSQHFGIFYDGLSPADANVAIIQDCDIRGGKESILTTGCDVQIQRNKLSEFALRGIEVQGIPGNSDVKAVIHENDFTGSFVVGNALQNTVANGMSIFNAATVVDFNSFTNLAGGFAVITSKGTAANNKLINVGLGINVVQSPGFVVERNIGRHSSTFTAVLVANNRLSGHIRLFESPNVQIKNNMLLGANINLTVASNSTNAVIEANIIRNAVKVGNNSGVGISFTVGSAQGAQVHKNNIENNATFALHDFGGTSFTINATDNWWGSPSGPPSAGTNAVISPNVVFTPFLTSPNLNAGP